MPPSAKGLRVLPMSLPTVFPQAKEEAVDASEAFFACCGCG